MVIISILNKQYPYLRNWKKGVISNLIVGAFIAFFLIVFKPFQIGLWQTEYKTLKLIGFGFISFIVPTLLSLIPELIASKSKLEDSWKIWHEVISLIAVLCGIALCNLIYGNYLHIMHFSLSGYLSAFTIVITVGIFPIVFYVLTNQNRHLKISLANAKFINSEIETLQLGNKTKDVSQESEVNNNNLVFISENEKDKLVINPSQLLYIESADNYSNIVFTENGNNKKQLMRTSLKRIESQLNSSFVMRCHRTFIINLKNIKHIEGNAAGYKVYFSDNDTVIPVSRSYSNLVIEKLKALN